MNYIHAQNITTKTIGPLKIILFSYLHLISHIIYVYMYIYIYIYVMYTANKQIAIKIWILELVFIINE